jgi:hypothetical protein
MEPLRGPGTVPGYRNTVTNKRDKTTITDGRKSKVDLLTMSGNPCAETFTFTKCSYKIIVY